MLLFSLLRHRPCSQKFVCFAKKSANRLPFLVRTIFFTYSGTAPYGHFGNTVTSLLGPLFFAARQNDHSFSLKKKTLVNTAKCFWPIVDRINRVPYQNFRNRQLLPNFKGPVEKLSLEADNFLSDRKILCSLTAVPRQVIPPKNFLQLTFLVIRKISRLICEQGCKNEKLVIIFRPNANKASVRFKRLP